MLELDDRPVDALIPQGDDTYLLRNLWSEMRFVPAPEGQPPQVSLRPLWFTTEPKPLERVP